MEGYDNTQVTDVTSHGVIQEQTHEQVKYILGIDDIERDFQLYLRRASTWDSKLGTWATPKGVKPLLNEEGVNEILADLKFRASRIFSLSDYDDAGIKQTTKYYGKNILKLLYANADRWEIDKIQIPKMVHDMADMVYATLRKAKFGQMRNMIKDTSKYVETRNLSPNKGGFNFLK